MSQFAKTQGEQTSLSEDCFVIAPSNVHCHFRLDLNYVSDLFFVDCSVC